MLKPNTEDSRRRVGPHTRLTQIWRVVFASLVVDAVLVFIAWGSISEATAETIAIICSVVTIPFLDQRQVAIRMSRLRNFSKGENSNRTRTIQLIVCLVAVTLLAPKLLLIPRTTNIVGLILALVITIGVIINVTRALREGKLRKQALLSTPSLQITLWETQLVTILTIPIVAARLISLFGALSVHDARVSGLSAGCFAVSALLLVCLRPDRKAFIGLCARCKTPVPIAFVEYGKCPACDQDLQTFT